MSGANARAAIALKARILDAVGAPSALGPRARRLSRRLADRARGEPMAPVAFADIAALPDWASWPPARLRTFVDLAGAMACAPALHRTVDGKVLRRLAGRIGEDALDAVLTLPPTADVATAARCMRDAEVHRLLIVEAGTLVGIVTTTDVARAVAEGRVGRRTFVFPTGRGAP